MTQVSDIASEKEKLFRGHDPGAVNKHTLVERSVFQVRNRYHASNAATAQHVKQNKTQNLKVAHRTVPKTCFYAAPHHHVAQQDNHTLVEGSTFQVRNRYQASDAATAQHVT